MTTENARQIALSLPGAEEHPHFNRPSFRVKGKIFSTLWPVENRMMVKLSLIDQSVFIKFDPAVIYPVPGGWGRQGATFIELKTVKKAMLKDALTTAWLNVAPKKLVEQYFGKNG